MLTKAEQLCGNVWKFLKTVEEAECDQGAFISSLLCSIISSSTPSLDEDGRDGKGGAGGVDAQRNLPRLG